MRISLSSAAQKKEVVQTFLSVAEIKWMAGGTSIRIEKRIVFVVRLQAVPRKYRSQKPGVRIQNGRDGIWIVPEISIQEEWAKGSILIEKRMMFVPL